VTHPGVRDLFQTLGRHQAFQDLAGKLVRREAGSFSLGGLTPTAKALYLVLLWQATERPMLIIADGSQRAELLTELTGTFFDLLISHSDARPHMIPALDVLPGAEIVATCGDHGRTGDRVVADGEWHGADYHCTGRVGAVSHPCGDHYRRLALLLRVGEELPLDTIEAHLHSIGYEKRDPVEMVGEYSIRGGILDVFPADNARPLRVEFFGDEIESIRRFDVDSQRSVMKITEGRILPLLEQPRTVRRFPGGNSRRRWRSRGAFVDRPGGRRGGGAG